MPQLSRVGDTNEMKGAIISGASTVFANGILVGLQGSKITPHAPFKGLHKNAMVTDGSPTVFVEGLPVARVSSGNSCGHHIIQGSPDVFCP
jgi:uncharacterized Zn-binding protein involved in type VI secretion